MHRDGEREGDSLDVVEFIMELEKDVGIDVPDDAVSALAPGFTLGVLWRTLRRDRGAAERPPATDPLWIRLRLLYARSFGVPVDDVDPDTRVGGG